jgi:hypothetical protein
MNPFVQIMPKVFMKERIDFTHAFDDEHSMCCSRSGDGVLLFVGGAFPV